MKRLVIDLESRSCADLKKAGVYVYANDPTTSITHVGWKNGADIQMWRPSCSPIPNALADALADERAVLVAHNASFERQMMAGPAGQAIGFPATLGGLERWDCTAARSAHIGLPRDLQGACRALRLPPKDAVGHRLMLQVSKPRTKAPLTWWTDEPRMVRMDQYCRRDVEIEAELDRIVPALSPAEHEVWLSTERLNDRGIAVDQILLQQLIELAEAARHDLNRQLATLTGGAVPKLSANAALTQWLISQGCDVTGCAQDVVEGLLEDDDLDPLVREVLEIRQAGGGSSSQKTAAIARQLSADGRIHGSLIYGGAPATLRWSSHGAQLHNLPRHNPEFLPRAILRDVADGATPDELGDVHGPVLKLVSELLRPVLIADEAGGSCVSQAALATVNPSLASPQTPSAMLVFGDYAQIEARVLAWLAGQEDRLDVFRAFDAGTGPDPYRVTASRIYEGEITPERRQIGKVADLALGYQGGSKAFKSMAKNFGLRITTGRAEEIKFAWRRAHPHIEHFWWALDAAARECLIQPPGPTFTVRRVSFRRRKHALMMRLPSGRDLVYWEPCLKEAETPWGELRIQPHYWSQDAVTRQWVEFKAYGGLFCENATQATARDILGDALVRLDAAGLNPVLTVHDEAICETSDVGAVTEIMKTIPVWADGFPVAVDVDAAPRYLKGKT